MEAGQTVRLIQPVIKGRISDTRYNKEAKCLEHLVGWIDAAGNMHERWFTEPELELIDEPA